MMYRKALLFGVLAGLAAAAVAGAEEAPDPARFVPERAAWKDEAANLVVFVEAKPFKSRGAMYDVRYTVANDASSKQKVTRITIGPGPEVAEHHAPEGWSYVRDDGVRGWKAADASKAIAPGATLSGFWVRSQALPGLVTGGVDGEGGATATGRTVAPVIVAAGAQPDVAAMLDALKGYALEVHELGWVGDPDSADGLLGCVMTAKRVAQQGATAQVIDALRGLNGIVEYCRDIKPEPWILYEAYGLFQTNAQYLMERLQQQPLAPPQ